jgi:hypothetical protein
MVKLFDPMQDGWRRSMCRGEVVWAVVAEAETVVDLLSMQAVGITEVCHRR